MLGIEYIRKEISMTMQELADRLSITKTVISNWETGKKAIPLKRLDELEKIFGIPKQFFNMELSLMDIRILRKHILEYKKMEEKKRIEEIKRKNKECKFQLYDDEATSLFHELYQKLEIIGASEDSEFGEERVSISFDINIANESFMGGILENFNYSGLNRNSLVLSSCEYDFELYIKSDDITHIEYDEENEEQEIYTINFGLNRLDIILDKTEDTRF